MLKLLVTVGAGYIGSVLVPELLALGHHVLVLDNFMYKQNSLSAVCSCPRFEVVNGDVRIKSTIKPLLSDIDVIIPLASYVGAPLCSKNPIDARSVNRDAQIMLFDLLSKNQLVIMPTTNSAYGKTTPGTYCTEESPLNPISQYAVDKVYVENELLNHEMSISLRFATVFGMSPRMRIDLLVNSFTYKAVNDSYLVLFEGNFRRNYIHVKDAAGAIIHSLKNIDTMKNNIYNVGLSSANISKLELCKLIKKRLNDFVYFESTIGKDPDQRDYLVSNEKLTKTGFIPNFSLEKGIDELIKGFKMIKDAKYSNA